MRQDNGLDLSLDLWLKLAHPLGYVRDPQLRKFWLHSDEVCAGFGIVKRKYRFQVISGQHLSISLHRQIRQVSYMFVQDGLTALSRPNSRALRDRRHQSSNLWQQGR
jgi:hypothetical protein